MEVEVEIKPVLVTLCCDKCGTEIDTSGVSATVVDGVKVIPSKCPKCEHETQQTKRYPYVKHVRV
jgi:hypothetical protein